MTGDSKAIDIVIMGREFRIACAEGERDALLEAVAYLDGRMREIRDSGKVIGLERIAIMAALNIAHEYLRLKASPGFDMAEFRRRIGRMEAAIDAAIAEQSELF
jgi:cell division protein ZapA